MSKSLEHEIQVKVTGSKCVFEEYLCKTATQKLTQTKILMTNGSLMKVKNIAECSPWSILQYICPSLSNNWS